MVFFISMGSGSRFCGPSCSGKFLRLIGATCGGKPSKAKLGIGIGMPIPFLRFPPPLK